MCVKERKNVCLCVFERESEMECVNVRERESDEEIVCVRERERGRIHPSMVAGGGHGSRDAPPSPHFQAKREKLKRFERL